MVRSSAGTENDEGLFTSTGLNGAGHESGEATLLSKPADWSPEGVTEGEDGEKEISMEELDLSQKAPDGGYGWLIVLGSALAHVILGGLDRSDGIFFLKLETAFGQGAQATAWIASLSSACRLMFGPVASAFSNRYSSRAAAIMGGIVTTVGFLLCMAAPRLEFLYFSFSLVSGLGRCFAYTPSLVIVGLYFNKRRGLAVGLATAGVGVGTLILPPIIEMIFEVYTTKGAFLVLSAIPLNLCVCGALYRPLHKLLAMTSKGRKKNPQTALKSEVGHLLVERQEVLVEENGHRADESGDGGAQLDKPSASQPCQATAPSDLCNGGSTKHRKSPIRRLGNICSSSSREKKSDKPKLLEISLLKVPSFLLYCFSISVFTGAFKVGFTFLPALAKSKGCSEMEGALLMSIAGVVDTVGRITAGIILDLKRIRPLRPLIYNGVIFAVAAIAFICPFVSSFTSFAFLSGLFGLLTGTYVSQKSVIIVDILGVEKLTSSFGLLIFFQGIGSLLAPPLAGALKDIYGQYNEAFYLGGSLMVMAAILMTISNILRVSQLRKEKKTEEVRTRENQEETI